ncbi:hypothetical protein ACFFX0_09585 [Citricoccus parietis]|uniref:Uncharacterized protein n=1 Tax=Citricoccus parietis TaxID=592307 RepID=A0ABV5FXM7_9MICC
MQVVVDEAFGKGGCTRQVRPPRDGGAAHEAQDHADHRVDPGPGEPEDGKGREHDHAVQAVPRGGPYRGDGHEVQERDHPVDHRREPTPGHHTGQHGQQGHPAHSAQEVRVIRHDVGMEHRHGHHDQCDGQRQRHLREQHASSQGELTEVPAPLGGLGRGQCCRGSE